MTYARRAYARRFTLVLLACSLTACPGGKTASPKQSPAAKPVRGGILSVALAEDVDFLDPHRAGQPSALALIRAMHRGLMAFPAEEFPKGVDPVPDLAEAPPAVSADRLVYTFRLREGIGFGPPASRAVTANDVRAGISRLLALDSPFATYFRVIASVTTPDERTVVVRLAKPVNDLVWMLAHPAAAAIPVELERQRRPAPASISPSGPYRLSPSDGYRPESSIHLIRNPGWRLESDPVRGAYVDEIAVRIGGTPADIERGIASQTFDLSLDAPPPLLPTAATLSPSPEKRPDLRSVPSGCLRYLWMNTSIAPFNDIRVRRAVASAVDRTPILAAAGGADAGTVTASPLVRTLTGAPAEPSAPSPQPSAAAATFRSLRFPRGFAISLVVGGRTIDIAQARAVESALAAASAPPVRIRALPIATVYVDAYEIPATRTPMGIATWCADWPGLGGRAHLTPLLDGRRIPRTGNQNYSMVRDATLNRLLDAAAGARADGASAAWRAAAARVDVLAAWVPLLDLNEVSLVGPRVGGFVAPPMFPRGDPTAIWLEAGAPPPATSS